MLDKELDKLRDKTLSFWCLLNVSFYDNEEHKYLWKYISCVLNNNRFAVVDELIDYKNSLYWLWKFTKEDEWIEIIWHPLTRWRIEHCYRDNYPINKPVHKYITMRTLIYRWFESNRETAYNQSELERMQHEKRPELKELLLKFSNYL